MGHKSYCKPQINVKHANQQPIPDPIRVLSCSFAAPGFVHQQKQKATTLQLSPSAKKLRANSWRGLFRLPFLLQLGDGDSLAHIAHLEAGKAPHGDVLAQLADLARDQLVDADARLFHERLVQQADLLVEL